MSRTVQVTFDCADPNALAGFWNEVLGYRYDSPPPGFATWEEALDHFGVPEEDRNNASASVDPEEHGPRLFFQKVPEGKTAKNRLHLDVRAAPGLQGDERMAALEAECDRLVALGGEPAAAPRARAADERRLHRDERPRGQRVLPRLRTDRAGRTPRTPQLADASRPRPRGCAARYRSIRGRAPARSAPPRRTGSARATARRTPAGCRSRRAPARPCP